MAKLARSINLVLLIPSIIQLIFLFSINYGYNNYKIGFATSKRINTPPFPRQFNYIKRIESNASTTMSSDNYHTDTNNNDDDDDDDDDDDNNNNNNNNNNVNSNNNNDDDDNGYGYDIGYYEQSLDHFSFKPESNNTFPQRYLVNTRHWREEGGPILFYCGNEGDIEWFALNTGFMWDLAPQLNAMLIFAEHRYYGKSVPRIPLNNLTMDTLGFLTSEQALADFASLITDLKSNYSAQASPVIAIGGSYGGMLAAWFRLKYPHIVIGALASSAPILQFDDIVPRDSFYRIASNNFKRESLSCFETIRDSWNALENVAKDPRGLEDLFKEFKFCRNVSKSLETLESHLEISWTYLPMVNYPYPSDFLMPLPPNPIKEVCKKIDGMPHGTNIISRVFAGAQVYWNWTGNTQCFDPNEDPHGTNLWDWQACTEMIMTISSNPKNSMFRSWNFSLDDTILYCQSMYGVTPRPKWITQQYGGHNITLFLRRFGSNIIFSNGLLDPWSGSGVLTNISSTLVAIVTELGAHHLDLRSATKYDPQWLVSQRNEEIFYIKDWIKQYVYDSTYIN